MAKKTEINFKTVAFENGALRELAGGGNGSREAVLALPLSRLLVQFARVPAEKEVLEEVLPLLKAASPYPDEDLTPSFETLCETAKERLVLAAALPESATEDIGEALDASKLSILRIDCLELGTLANLMPQWSAEDVRRLIVIPSSTEGALTLAVVDGALPVALRAVSAGVPVGLEVTLALLSAEDFHGSKPLKEVIRLGNVEEAPFKAFGPVRAVELAPNADLQGVQARTLEGNTLDARPESWKEVLAETRFKAKLTTNLVAAGAIWAMALGVMFAVPLLFQYRTDYQKKLTRSHNRAYEAVKDMKDKTDLVKKYSDHARGALEIMKALSDRLPEGVELNNWDFKRDEGVKVSGTAQDANAIYKFKDTLAEMGAEPDEDGNKGDPVFPSVELSGLNASKDGQRFTIDCRYATGEDEQ